MQTPEEELKELKEKINKVMDVFMENYKCTHHTVPSYDNPHGCTDCYNYEVIPDCPLSTEVFYQFMKVY